jgi:uncharacterized membrane protein (DUF485 family)
LKYRVFFAVYSDHPDTSGDSMLHEPASSSGPDPASAYKTRLGLQMFAAYVVFYAGFVALRLLWPETMSIKIVFGLNLAIVYGFALIVLAIVQALIYNHLCTTREREMEAPGDGKEG